MIAGHRGIWSSTDDWLLIGVPSITPLNVVLISISCDELGLESFTSDEMRFRE